MGAPAQRLPPVGRLGPSLLLPRLPLQGSALAEVRVSRGSERVKADRLGQCRQGRLDSLAAPASNRGATLVLVIKYGRAEGLGDRGSQTHTGPGCLRYN